MQLTAQYPDLSQMFGQDSLYGTLYGMDRFKQAQQNEQQNLQQAVQSQQLEAARAPLDNSLVAAQAAHTNALSGLTQAQIPGVQAESTSKVRADQVDAGIPMDTKIKAAASHLAANMSDDEAKTAHDKVVAGLTSDNPQIRAHAQAMYPLMSEVQLQKQKLTQEGENSARVAGIEGSAHVQAAQIAADASRANASMHYGNDAWFRKSMSGNFQDQSGGWSYKSFALQQEAADEPDPSRKAKLLAQAQQASEMSQLAKDADINHASAAAYQANMAKPDINGFGIQSVTPPSGAPNPRPGATPTAPLIPTNDKAPTDTGKVLMRDKSGVLHMVPKENATKALQMGWSTGQPNAPQIPQ